MGSCWNIKYASPQVLLFGTVNSIHLMKPTLVLFFFPSVSSTFFECLKIVFRIFQLFSISQYLSPLTRHFHGHFHVNLIFGPAVQLHLLPHRLPHISKLPVLHGWIRVPCQAFI